MINMGSVWCSHSCSAVRKPDADFTPERRGLTEDQGFLSTGVESIWGIQGSRQLVHLRSWCGSTGSALQVDLTCTQGSCHGTVHRDVLHILVVNAWHKLLDTWTRLPTTHLNSWVSVFNLVLWSKLRLILYTAWFTLDVSQLQTSNPTVQRKP